ncbi:hypothetical protein E3N88_37622 [Mikania micrantha]|uniref:Uncharacterized protein n=1 Tax=Mikania micrantha TaxID=192012 RepID=A0A5N6LSM5_9ASTR|nr:hypothetical protein E3N88_37622 [Mikania micrantha]
MGLNNQLTDVSSDSLPVFFLAIIANGVCYLRKLISTVLRSVGISQCRSDEADDLMLFDAECFDGWLDYFNFKCPICRAPVVSDERVVMTRRRLTDDVMDWFSFRW